MCSFSTYMENKILNHVFGKTSYSLSHVYVGLLSSAPNEDGTSVSEPDSSSYARIATNPLNWQMAIEGLMENASNIKFDMACENWGTMTHFALFDAASGGNILAFGSLSPSKTVNSGDIASFAPGDLIISID